MTVNESIQYIQKVDLYWIKEINWDINSTFQVRELYQIVFAP